MGDLELNPEPEIEMGTGTTLKLDMGAGTVLEPEMEAKADRGNKYSALHPWHESVVRRKTGQGASISLESGACDY